MKDDAAGVTLVNVFELPADQVDAFVTQWHRIAESLVTKPGFQDTRLHRALSPDARFQLVNVAHWDSREAFEAAVSSPEFQNRAQETRRTAANPALYQVIASYNAPHDASSAPGGSAPR
jgi:heme-degrading monooxygenase HmoA